LEELGELASVMVFVGGIVVDFYTDYKQELRSTLDIDVVIEAAGYSEYHEFESKLLLTGWSLRSLKNDPPCRFTKNGIVLDVMPETTNQLLLSNEWYMNGFRKKEKLQLSQGQTINLFPFEYYLASKMTAFKSRGQSNFLESKDMIDIFNILARSDLKSKVENASSDAKNYIAKEFKSYQNDFDFDFALNGHFKSTEIYRAESIRSVIDSFVEL
jgi:hypothetical protein